MLETMLRQEKRRCTGCGKLKDEIDFLKRSKTKNTGTCKDCQLQRNRTARDNNLDEARKRARDRYWKDRGMDAPPKKASFKGKRQVYFPSEEDLLALFKNADIIVKQEPRLLPYKDVKVNEVIDKTRDGLDEPRIRRECLLCGSTFIGIGKNNRRCYACKQGDT